MCDLFYVIGYFSFGLEFVVCLVVCLVEYVLGDLNYVYFMLGGLDVVDSMVCFVWYYWYFKG